MKHALILFPDRGILGDVIAWFPQAVRFGQVSGLRLTVIMHERLIPLFRGAYPDIAFFTDHDPLPRIDYVAIDLCHFPGTTEEVTAVGTWYVAAHILGIEHVYNPPMVCVASGGRPIAEPYVCIATQSTAQCKYWNNPHGWQETVAWLRETGYRVICIDRDRVFGTDDTWNPIPDNAEDETGDKPLIERARWLKHADFFVGLSSGLAWLAWACRTPVVMISGFTKPHDEFATPYRVINRKVCHGCHSDHFEPDPSNWMWCPRQHGTSRQFECTREISVDQVKEAIQKIPGFGLSRRSDDDLRLHLAAP